MSVTLDNETYDDEIWRMADGTAIRVGDMTPRHALNSYRMMYRRLHAFAESLVWNFIMSGTGPLGPQGDMACDAFDDAVDSISRWPLIHAEREPIMKALFLRSLDTWPGADVPEGWPQPRYEGVPAWDRHKVSRVQMETRWAACAYVGPQRWRQVCVGSLEAVWQFARDSASRGMSYKCVRFEYIDPATGVYTEDEWERRERAMIMRRSEDSMLGSRLSRHRVLSPAELAERAAAPEPNWELLEG